MTRKSILLLAIVLAGASALVAQPRYTGYIQHIEPARNCWAFGINDGGAMVGTCYTTKYTPYGWNPPTNSEWVYATAPDYEGAAYGVNNYGSVVGGTGGVSQYSRYWYGADSTYLAPQLFVSRAVAVNDSGLAAGFGTANSGEPPRALRFNTALPGTAEYLFPAGVNSNGTAINQNGWVAGDVTVNVLGTWRKRAYVWNGQTVSYLPDPGLTLSKRASWALGLNNIGDVVVGSRVINNTGYTRPVAWRGGIIADLPVSSATTRGDARAVNDSGYIVGNLTLSGAPLPVATIWYPPGAFPVSSATLLSRIQQWSQVPGDPICNNVEIEDAVAITDGGLIAANATCTVAWAKTKVPILLVPQP